MFTLITAALWSGAVLIGLVALALSIVISPVAVGLTTLAAASR